MLVELRSRLLLRDGRRLLDGPPGQDYWLLRPDYAVVPFHPAREPEVEKLISWCEDDDRRRAVRLLHERGGAGKTRLAMELARRLTTKGWHAGFLDRMASGAPPEALQRLCDGKEALLVIVDYAETRREELVELLRHARGGTAPRLRVLLLARAAAEWWERLGRASADAQELLVGHGDTYPSAPVGERRRASGVALFDAAAMRFQEKLELQGPIADPPDLALAQFATPLFVHLAALAAARGQTIEAAEDLLDEVIKRERRAWNQGLEAIHLAPDEYEPLVAQAVTLATLAGNATDRGMVEAVVERAPLAYDQPAIRRRAIAGLVARLYPEPESLGALGPDLLGEQLVAQELPRHTGLLHASLGARTTEEQQKHALTVLGRIAMRSPARGDLFERAVAEFPEELAKAAITVGLELGTPVLVQLEHMVADACDEPLRLRIALALEPHLPYPTTAARSVAVAVLELVVSERRRQTQDGTETARNALANALNRLSGMLSAVGRDAPALAPAQEAVEIYRKLSADRPDAFLAELAGALNDLAIRLSALGHRERALEVIQEAVDIVRKLTADRPEDFLPLLAMALNTSAGVESAVARREPDVGRGERSVAAAREAVEVHRNLVPDPPNASPHLGGALINLGAALSSLDCHEEALTATQEALGIFRRLATARPDAFRPDLALGLDNLGCDLAALSLHKPALDATQEAVDLYKELAADRTDAFLPELARALNNLRIRLSALGRHEPAIEAAAEAAGHYRKLAADRPDAFLPDLAMSLGAYGSMLVADGRAAEASDAFGEGIRWLSPAFLRLPEAVAPLMGALARSYAGACEASGSEPDTSLLEPILATLAKVETKNS